MRAFVVVGRTASAEPDFLLDDLPGTSGRLDVLLRCVRAALLVSHGLRRDTRVYLVLLGRGRDGIERGPKTVRIDGGSVRFVRPDERSLSVLMKKVLALPAVGDGFVEVKPGIAVAEGGLAIALDDLAGAALYVLDEGAPDIRSAPLGHGDAAFVLGDHLGIEEEARAELQKRHAERLGLGPVSVHADDAIAVLWNELDRRAVG